MLYHVITNGELKTISLDPSAAEVESAYVKVPINGYLSEPDVWIHTLQYN